MSYRADLRAVADEAAAMPPGFAAAVSEALLKQMRKQSCSQRELARLSGTSSSTVHKGLTGARTTTPATFDRWAEVLDCEWQVKLVPKD